MAMTKAERAEFEQIATEAALRWPTEAEPQPVTLEHIKAHLVQVTPRDQSIHKNKLVYQGWVMNAYSGVVEHAWSDGLYHGRGNWTGDSSSQSMGQLYATKREAIIAMRWAMCREMAKRLRAVDLKDQSA